MSVCCLVFTLVAIASPQAGDAARSPRTVHDAAAAFTLDSVTPPQDDAVVAPDPAPAQSDAVPTTMEPPTDNAPSPPSPPSADTVAGTGVPATAHGKTASMSWLDVPIASLIANPTTRRVLDRDLPGLSSDENLARFETLSLHRFQPLTGGQLTDAMLAKVERDLDTAPPPRPNAAASVRSER